MPLNFQDNVGIGSPIISHSNSIFFPTPTDTSDNGIRKSGRMLFCDRCVAMSNSSVHKH